MHNEIQLNEKNRYETTEYLTVEEEKSQASSPGGTTSSTITSHVGCCQKKLGASEKVHRMHIS